jgi:hypothetical protein
LGTSYAGTQVPEDPAQWQVGSRKPGIPPISRNTGPVIAREEAVLPQLSYDVYIYIYMCVCVCVCGGGARGWYNYCAISYI